MNILVCNAGSTSLKFKLFDFPSVTVLATGKVERVGGSDAIYHFDMGDKHVKAEGQNVPDYMAGVKRFMGDLGEVAIDAVGFKTVLSKGFPGVHLIDENVMQGMRDYLSVAPAHNTAYLEVTEVFRALMPETPLVGSFETAFHITIPMMRNTFGFVVVSNSITNLLLFAPMYVQTNGGPSNSTNVLMLEAYKSAYSYNNMGRSYTIVTILILVSILFLWIQNKFFRITD